MKHENISVRIAAIEKVGFDLLSFELVPLADEDLPSFEAGAHIDIILPGGVRRQYSLYNSPSQSDRYLIAVKLEENSRGGSQFMHKNVRVGDIFEISSPRNLFKLKAKSEGKNILLAGGVGITPLLSMAQHLSESGKDFSIDYFVREENKESFSNVFRDNNLLSHIHVHSGLTPNQTEEKISEILSNSKENTDAYVCGPHPFIQAVLNNTAAWEDGSVHYESFSSAIQKNDSGASDTDLYLSRSDLTLKVPASKSIAEAIIEAGVELETSCMQGVCGVCCTSVIEGDLEHEDAFLSDDERESGKKMMPCVSRAKSPRLVLDI